MVAPWKYFIFIRIVLFDSLFSSVLLMIQSSPTVRTNCIIRSILLMIQSSTLRRNCIIWSILLMIQSPTVRTNCIIRPILLMIQSPTVRTNCIIRSILGWFAMSITLRQQTYCCIIQKQIWRSHECGTKHTDIKIEWPN